MAKVQTTAEKAIRRATCELVAEKPITALTVTEICNRAQTTRDSFYRFATDPADMLAQCLFDDHDVSAVIPSSNGDQTEVQPIEVATRLLIAHVQRNALIYRNSMVPRMVMAVRDQLRQRLTSVLAVHAAEHPERLPMIQGRPPDALAVSTLIAHQANGVIGALEHLLEADRISDTELALQLLHAAAAPWWWFEYDIAASRKLPSQGNVNVG